MIEDDDIQILKGYVFRMYPTKEQERDYNAAVNIMFKGLEKCMKVI